MRVREAEGADVGRLADIRASDTEAGPADPRMERYLAGTNHPGHALSSRVMYLALDEDRVTGYIAGHLTMRFDCEGGVQYLYVARDYRSRGAASALLEAVGNWFIGLGA
jgi:GNAT superfamily N-acetyltransferase